MMSRWGRLLKKHYVPPNGIAKKHNKKEVKQMYDVIIVGAGPAGISASLYTVRRNLKTLIIYKEKSALEKSTRIENYYGF